MGNLEALKAFLRSQMPPGLEMLRQMVDINTFTANREGVKRLALLTARCFEPMGFKAEFVPSSNPAWGDHLVMTRPGRSSRSLALISHLDTVFPPEEEVRNHFHWQMEGDRIYGPGTHDIKGGTLMMWLVLASLKSHAPELFAEMTWKLLWNSSEECFSADFQHVCRSRFDAGTVAALVFEAEGRSASERLLVVARKGRGTFRATVHGRGAHAGGRHRAGANAVVQLGATVQKIAQLTDYSRGLTFNVATLAGGTVLNRVPHEAVAEGEFRAFDEATFEMGKRELLALGGLGDVKSPEDGYACNVEIEVLNRCPPWPRNPATDRLFGLWKEVGESLGMKIGVEERGGLSDGNLLWDAVPTLDGLGPWGDNDHCSERSPDGSKTPEFVEVSSFEPKALLNTLAIIRLAGL